MRVAGGPAVTSRPSPSFPSFQFLLPARHFGPCEAVPLLTVEVARTKPSNI
jgi:hypothetical protein